MAPKKFVARISPAIKMPYGYELRTLVSYASERLFIKALNKYVSSDRLDTFINEVNYVKLISIKYFVSLSLIFSDYSQKYMANNNQKLTLLMVASKYGRLKIIKHLLKKCIVDIDATGNVKHFRKISEGVSALWLAAG